MSLDIDRSTWTRVAFGDAIESVTDRVDDPRLAGVDRYVGLEHLDPGSMTVQRWDSPDKVEAQKLRFQPGDVIFGRRRAYQKKVAQAGFEGICSAHALVLRAKSGAVDPSFLPVFLSSDHFLNRAISISVGSLSPTVNWRDLKVQEFDLPPLDEQRRIARLVWSVERHRRAASDVVSATQRAQANVLTHRLASLPEVARIGDLATTRSGPSFAAADVHETPVPGSSPVLGIPNTKPDGTIDLAEVGHVTGLSKTVGRIDASSLILIRTNGNRGRIGNVYLPPEPAHGYAVSAFQFLMQAKDAADREFLYCALRDCQMQQRMSDAASGTVGLGNLAVKWLNEETIPWSSDASARRALTDDFRRMSEAVEAQAAEVDAVTNLRSSLLSNILGGT